MTYSRRNLDVKLCHVGPLQSLGSSKIFCTRPCMTLHYMEIVLEFYTQASILLHKMYQNFFVYEKYDSVTNLLLTTAGVRPTSL